MKCPHCSLIILKSKFGRKLTPVHLLTLAIMFASSSIETYGFIKKKINISLRTLKTHK